MRNGRIGKVRRVVAGLPAGHADFAKTKEQTAITILAALGAAGFRCWRPSGAYYVMTDISEFGFPDDMAFVRRLIEKAGVAAVPGSSFFHNPRDGARIIRFCFSKKCETLKEAAVRLHVIAREGKTS